ncbi:MAG: DNA replication and repair protein RecF [Candidatus Andersenbacteria bacterium]
MKIRELTIHNFRNILKSQTIEFPEANLLIAAAPNATGKTNFLEALIVLLRGKSFRASHEECVGWGEEYFLVKGLIDRDGGQKTLAVQYHAPTKKLRIEEDGQPVSPVTFYSHYPVILFLPEDTFIFYRGPAARRNLLNTTLVSSPQYLSAIVQYQRALRQRNSALKAAGKREDVSVWSDVLVGYAQDVWVGRQALVQYMNTHINELYNSLFNEQYDFTIELITGAPEPQQYQNLLQESWEYERRYKYTLYGPHRDDIRIMANGREVSSVLSRGQMRSLVIALKVAAFGYVRQTLNTTPILLFDEVLSELDEVRQKNLLKHLPDAQILLTCTAVPEGVKQQEGAYMLDLHTIVATKDEVGGGVGSTDGHVDVVEEEQGETVAIQA